ncbi:MAG: glycosyltransferase family 4 protein [Desulfuromonadaceae bacterium]|nr:glycosyltransferase family 4 protein [Desulfuromonadaceae bacterium]
MRILHITSLISFGGIESYVKELAIDQQKMGHQVGILICLKSDSEVDEEVQRLSCAGIWVDCIDAHSGHDLKLTLRLPGAIRRFCPDIIHLSSTPLFAAMALRLSRAPKIVTLHLIDDNSLKEKFVNYIYSSFVDGAIAVSDTVLNFHRNACGRYAQSKWIMIYNGIRLERFIPDRCKNLPLQEEECILTMSCRMEADKHVDDAIRTLAILRRKTSDRTFRLRLLGSGSALPSLKKLAFEQGVADFVDFLGYQIDVHPFLLRSHGHLVLSDRETFSIAALEAMACALPIFSFPVPGGFHELHRPGISGLVSATRTPEALATSILEGFSKPEAWKRWSQQSKSIANTFSIEVMAAKTDHFYQSILPC